ncbi:tetraacyldisaccharide 4'-kinase [Thiohalocapsa halophila]|uniref:Tetraacyldisaccharide 4'-kinase n=1 Tax=Thiohalocapsa halophila TaxID=69359 RepID=A0ABS1CP42_9GAMM|nr:tetraacyldisaccharide 4'-kinase [Thiohalocapsa halophila]MBK1633706.1 tetraacyldisaccharide 4'-kinase [Thiohalocapsa halophila]
MTPVRGERAARERHGLSPTAIWYGHSRAGRLAAALFAPLGWLYCGLAALRATAYARGWRASFEAGAPVIVVGNLSVGGTGKTPLVRWLAGHLRARGLKPGIAARGYGAAAGSNAGDVRLVPVDADPALFGDEPVLLAADGRTPVAVGRDRVAAARALVGHGCDVVVTDDGLQHYRLRRQCEILVVDGSRGHGNGRCLPAGPLREPVRRAARVDLAIATGGGQPGLPALALAPEAAVSLTDPSRTRPLADFAGERVTAVAGIGNPARFFRMLEAQGLRVDARAYPDHHRFTVADLAAWDGAAVLMTEKDAVKCRRLRPPAGTQWPELWAVPVAAVPDSAFVVALDRLLTERGVVADNLDIHAGCTGAAACDLRLD